MLVTLITYINGLVVSIGFLVLVVVSLPIYVYRYILQNVIVPLFFSKTIGQPVAPTSAMFATEFLDNYPPRCCIVSSFVIEGHVPYSEVEEDIRRKWILDTNTYPEFQQYIQSWMGFLFWHKDNDFDIRNHLHKHKLPAGGTNASSEKWICSKIEELLNKPFPPRRSPWEVHVIENYVNSELGASKKDVKLTAFVMRFHHGLADGFSILYAVIEGLFGTPLEKVSVAAPSKSSISSASMKANENGDSASKSLLMYAKRVVYDVGSFSNLVLQPNTPWHVPDGKKRWKQLYARSTLIPIDRLKRIKNKFGVSFTGVIFSCISAGVSKSLHGKSSKIMESLTTMAVLPLPGHSKKLTNHAASAIFDLPIDPSMDPVARLRKCEEGLQLAKQSTIPFFGVLSVRLVGCHLASVAKLLLANRAVPLGLSNFPGPGKEIEWNGRRGLSTDFIAGALNGVAGAGFMVLSYRNCIRIAATVENAIMEKDDLEQLINYVCQEIECLEKSSL